MEKSYRLALHIFRRDLRLADNSALIEALSSSEKVIPCFIFDKRQIEANDFKGDHSLQFMANSLLDLDTALKAQQGKLYFFYGIAEKVIADLIDQLPIEAIFLNRDYTPFSRERDQAIQKLCAKKNIHFHYLADALLHEPEEVLKPNREPYTVYTPFFKRATLLSVAKPRANTYNNYYQKPILLEDKLTIEKLTKYANPNLLLKGGRKEALALLEKIKKLSDYAEIRNFPALDGTTKLSAHHKFGTLSVRETYHTILKAFGKNHTLISELYWRDFFTHIGYHFPKVFKEAFQSKYQHIKWSHHLTHFRAWCEGRTGFPIVDAGMRELNTTGYMHNRVRMIVASFLTKDLHIDWHWGEKYFAQKLLDYDPAVNNGNWQWAASTGCDAQPYFRIFNPWLQQQKFDPECLYIKKWIPELATIPAKTIHDLNKHLTRLMTNYPTPIVDHSVESRKAIDLYKQA